VGVFDGGVISSDAGALLLGATDRAIGLVRRFAGCFSDGCEADCFEHTVATWSVSACLRLRWAIRTSTRWTERRGQAALHCHLAAPGTRSAQRKQCSCFTFRLARAVA
jgi:hypothetical protein